MITQRTIDRIKSDTGADILLFRVGDYFWEAVHEDAETVSRALGISTRDVSRSGQRIPACGFLYTHLDAYTAKLRSDGFVVDLVGGKGSE